MSKDSASSQTPALWEGALEEARELIGVELRRTGQQWNSTRCGAPFLLGPR